MSGRVARGETEKRGALKGEVEKGSAPVHERPRRPQKGLSTNTINQHF